MKWRRVDAIKRSTIEQPISVVAGEAQQIGNRPPYMTEGDFSGPDSQCLDLRDIHVAVLVPV